jgi:hypothetical protein
VPRVAIVGEDEVIDLVFLLIVIKAVEVSAVLRAVIAVGIVDHFVLTRGYAAGASPQV